MNSQTPLLTISLLISNRPDTIPRCLDSLRPIMEAIPSELILIDTSKSDEIHQMLFTYTDLVYEFEWCNDFAKARNEGIRRAKGKWFLYLDDDEWFEDVNELIDFFKAEEYKKCKSVNMPIRNYMNTEYTSYSDGWVSRLFYLGDDVRFEGKVHEYIYNLTGEQIFLPTMIYHSGYIFDSKEKRRKHFERNSKILLELIEEEPNELRWQAQMVQEYHTMDAWAEIIEFCKDRVASDVDPVGYMNFNHFCTLYAALAEAYLSLEKYDEFLAVCETAEIDERSTELLKAFLVLKKAEACVNMEELNVAKKYVNQYDKYYQYYRANEASMRTQVGALLINRTFEKNYLDTAENIRLYIDLKEGNIEALDACGEKLETDEKGFTISVKLAKYLVELMTTGKYKEKFCRIVKKAVQDETLCQMFCGEAQRWEEQDTNAFVKIAEIYAEAESDFWFLHYCRVVAADAKRNKHGVEKVLKGLLQAMPNVFYLPENAYDIIEKNHIRVALLWDEIVGENWVSEIQQLVMNCEEKAIQKVMTFLSEVYQEDDWHRLSLESASMEKKIAIGPQMKLLAYYELLKSYAQKKLMLYSQILEGTEAEDDLPLDAQAALKIGEYIELEAQDPRLALNRLKEVVDVYPIFAKGIGEFFHFYADLEKERNVKHKEEMEELKTQVMDQIEAMLSTGQVASALQIVGQLKQMFPEDLEVAELALVVRLKSLE